MSNKRIYQSCRREFKAEAVALVTQQGYSVLEAAASLGIRSNQLYLWKQQQEPAHNDSLLNTDEKAELVALRQEVKRLRLEKEILKKAGAFFAREMK